MDYLGHKKLEKNNGIYSSIDGIQDVGGLFPLIETRAPENLWFSGALHFIWRLTTEGNSLTAPAFPLGER